MSADDIAAGLCSTCRHVRLVSGRSSTFVLCRRSERDSSFPRYPRLPVLHCRGYERGGEHRSDTART